MKSWIVKRTLEKKLILINLLTFSLASAVVVVLIVAFLWTTARDDLLRHTEITAQVIAHNSAPAFLLEDKNYPKSYLNVEKIIKIDVAKTDSVAVERLDRSDHVAQQAYDMLAVDAGEVLFREHWVGESRE